MNETHSNDLKEVLSKNPSKTFYALSALNFSAILLFLSYFYVYNIKNSNTFSCTLSTRGNEISFAFILDEQDISKLLKANMYEIEAQGIDGLVHHYILPVRLSEITLFTVYKTESGDAIMKNEICNEKSHSTYLRSKKVVIKYKKEEMGYQHLRNASLTIMPNNIFYYKLVAALR